MLRTLTVAAGFAAALAGTAGAARLDPADLGYRVTEVRVFAGGYASDDDPAFGFFDLLAGGDGSLTINGIPPFAAADFDILLEDAPSAAGLVPALLGAASRLGDDGAAGFDLLFTALDAEDGFAFPAGGALLASIVFDTREPDGTGFGGDATTTVSFLAPIPLPAGGALLIGALGALAAIRRTPRT